MSVSEDLLCAFELLKVRFFSPSDNLCIVPFAPTLIHRYVLSAFGWCSAKEGNGKESSSYRVRSVSCLSESMV